MSVLVDRLIRNGVWYIGMVSTLGVRLHGRAWFPSGGYRLPSSFHASSEDKNAGSDRLRLVRFCQLPPEYVPSLGPSSDGSIILHLKKLG